MGRFQMSKNERLNLIMVYFCELVLDLASACIDSGFE